MIFEYLISYCANHFKHLTWLVSAVCALLTLLGKLFQDILNILYMYFAESIPGTKHPAAVDLKLTEISISFLRTKFTKIYWGIPCT